MASALTGSVLLDVVTDPINSGFRNTYNSGPAHPNNGNVYNLGETVLYVMRGIDTGGVYRYWETDFADGTAIMYSGPGQPLTDICVFKAV